MNINNEVFLTLVCIDDPELDDIAYQAYIDAVTLQLAKRLGALHGPNALKVLGDRVVRCTCNIDRDADSVSTVDVRCEVPGGMSAGDVIDVIQRFWAKMPLGGTEYYIR